MSHADSLAAELAAASAVLRRFPLIDGHNDLAWALREAGLPDPAQTDIARPVDFTHTDLPRLRAAASARSSGRCTCRPSCKATPRWPPRWSRSTWFAA